MRAALNRKVLMEKIDFVVLWVDGNDLTWKAEREKYAPSSVGGATDEIRFRDWDVMRYWFRGVEKFAPWVNHVYFVTCGHYPEWLNLDHPKLTLVKHADFIPTEYLPTFNSNTILLNIHRIPGLSEQFVVFNDDTFVTRKVEPKDFFHNEMPCEVAILGQISPIEWNPWTISIVNNMTLINRYFRKRDVVRRNIGKFYSLKYGKYLLQNILFSASPYFSNFRDMHLPASYLKEAFSEVWSAEPEILHNCCTNKFRSREDVTEWLMKYWQICSGRFYPRSINWGKMYTLGQDTGWAEAIRTQKYKAVCLNDCEELDFKRTQREMISAFETILPNQSQYELV